MPLPHNAADYESIVRHAAEFAVQNEARQFRAFGLTAPTVIVPNGIDPSKFGRPAPRLAERLDLEPEARTLLFLSRLHPKKGVDVLLRAFALVSGALPDVTLVVAGHDGGSGYATVLRRLAETLGIAGRCRFVGEVRGEAKLDLLSGADAFVLVSHSEGLPVAVIEAMASGLPVIITPGCNLPEVAKYNAGLIVEPRPESVGRAIADLFADRAGSETMGENGTRLVAEKFKWQRIGGRTIEIYGQLSAQSHALRIGS